MAALTAAAHGPLRAAAAIACPGSSSRAAAPLVLRPTAAPALCCRLRRHPLCHAYSPSAPAPRSGGGDGLYDDPCSSNAAAARGAAPDHHKRRSGQAPGGQQGGKHFLPTLNPAANSLAYEARPSRADDMETLPLLSRASSYSREVPEAEPPSQPPSVSWQYLVALCTLGIVICYADRSNISTAVLPMAEQFGWDKAYQGVVLSVFFAGYATTQILGGKLADQLGGKLVLASGVALWSLFTFLTPGAAAAGVAPLMLARVMLGVGEGVAFPSIHSLISRNVPQGNRTTAVGVVTAASYAGTALAFGVSPMIISTYGWQWVFYGFSALALLWLPLWLPVKVRDSLGPSSLPKVADKAAESPYASDGSVDRRVSASNGAASASGSKLATSGGSVSVSKGPLDFGPRFWALMRRREVWAICVAQYTQSWGMYGLLNWLPTFFSDFYKVELADLGSYTLLPYIVQGGLGVATGFFADRLLRGGWSVRTVRRSLQVVGMLGPAVCLLLAVSPAVGASAGVASTLITVGLGFSALTLGGVSASHLDIAPNNAGMVFGAGNTAATLAGLISVPVTGLLLQTTNSWPLVFSITALHYVVGAAVWAMWVGDGPLAEDSPDDGGSSGGNTPTAQTV